jgi:hypothetical protein
MERERFWASCPEMDGDKIVKASARPVICEVSKRRTLVFTDGLQAFLARRRASEAFVAGRAGFVCRARPWPSGLTHLRS